MNKREFAIYTQAWSDFITGIDIKNVKQTIRYDSQRQDYGSAFARLKALNEFMYYKDFIRKALK